ncbi:MAG: helix-turn-helix transcriptional regulator, partial [Pseudomonadota bacterium]
MTGMHSTGTRIREHRMLKGQKQADLAREIGISPTYLNLIEHNKRNIGGKLLSKIAARLDLDVAALTGGADADVVAGLLEAASANPALRAERDRVEDLTTRFPGWSAVIGAQQTRVADLERMVETLGDRVAHDPDLAAALHDVLTTATAIGAAASILTETKEIEPEWRDRFHRNIHEDSQRLAQSSQALVKFLEGSGVSDPVLRAPEEELDAWLAATDHHIAGLERSLPLTDELLFQSGPGLTSADAQALARPVFA